MNLFFPCRPIGNNQWQIVAHLKPDGNGALQIVPTNQQQISQTEQPQVQQQKILQIKQQSSVQPQKVVIHQQTQSSVQQQQLQQQQLQQQQQQQSQSGIAPSIEKSLLQGQPPGTIIKCVTAEVTKNQNGPCIKLTGIQGSELTEQQMQLVHQQVKQQLVKKGTIFLTMQSRSFQVIQNIDFVQFFPLILESPFSSRTKW